MMKSALLELGSFLILSLITAVLPVRTVAAEGQLGPILTLGVQEPDEMRVAPLPSSKLIDLTAPERMLGEALQNSDQSKPATLLPALNRILAQYPDFSDGYIMRAFALCDSGNDRAAIAADLDRALNSIATSRNGKDSLVSLLSTRAKLEYVNRDYAAAMNDLERAIRSDLEKAAEFTNSGAVKPEKTASMCVWVEPDMDGLVQRFPTDYRSYLFRGLYFSKFAPLDDDSLKPAIENLNRAAELSPRSALPQLFKATLLANQFVFLKRLNQLKWSDEARDSLNNELVREFNKALALDPDLLLALKHRALALFNLKRFEQAILDYNKVISLDPKDYADLNDRGLAKMYLGNTYDAISDITAAIAIRKREPAAYSLYEFRADAYLKTKQWDLAIRDLTTATAKRRQRP